MKLNWKKLICVCMSAWLGVSSGGEALAASEKSDGTNMQKVLNYYAKKQYKKAGKFNKKLSEDANEACVSKMTAPMKKAYLKIVKKYKVNAVGDKSLWGYYLTDIDNDKKTDLLIKIATCEADAKLYVYQFKSGKAKRIGSAGAFHTEYFAYPKHKGVVAYGGMMGEEWMRVVTVEGGQVIEKEIGSRDVGMEGEWFGLRCALNNHITYNSDYEPKLLLDELE